MKEELEEDGQVTWELPAPREPAIDVAIVEINIPFFSLVGFLVKLTLAAIPAAFISWLVIAWLIGVVGRMGAGH
jgi:hypothetical protein